MKQLLIGIILFSCTQGFTQTNLPIEHCNCEDSVIQEDSTFNGEYKRECNGKLIEQGSFINSEKDGEWKSWSKEGNQIRVFTYSNGIPNGDVKFYYPNGKQKVTGTFKSGKKNGVWIYYNDKGKVIKTGEYKLGVPMGIWKVFDWKGKKELFIYDFTNKEHIKNSGEQTYFKSAAIKQNDNTEEWYILHYPKRNNEANITPLEGYILSNDLYVNLMEVPLEIWDTYLQFDLDIKLTIESGGIKSIETTKSDNDKSNPSLTFLITTNDKEKLKNVEQSELSMHLLKYKVMEVLWLMGPWTGSDGSITIETSYVVNKFKDSPFH